MNLFLRAFIVLLVWGGLLFLVGDAGNYERPILVLGFLGAVALILGPLATEAGGWARGHHISTGTPGCVWVALGIICWLAVIALIISSKQVNP